ncbi:MAG: NUDIX domain-containing protein [Alphaproteobacteria bacterium]|nr:NUDIX domain-containing protein [Alphaproteobacteria bacterium]
MTDDESSTPDPSAVPSGPIHRAVPDGDNRERLMCRDCGFIHYQNPVVVVGAVATWNEGGAPANDRILLCRRAIEPRTGFWTLPAGYLEMEETTEAGAIRETWEEATARISIDRLLAVYNVPRLSQVQTIYRASLLSPDIAPGEESLEVGLFAWEDIPWDEIAFPTVRWALHQHRAVIGRADFAAFGNPSGDSADYF